MNRQQVLELGREIVDAMGDVLYEPWEYNDEYPEGFAEWSPEAIQAWKDIRAVDAAEAALGKLGIAFEKA